MLMQLLAAGGLPAATDGVRAPDDDNPRGYFELEAVKALGTPSGPSFTDLVGHAVKVIHPLVYRLPLNVTYHVLVIERDVRDVLASQARMLAHRGITAGVAETNARLGRVVGEELERLARWLAGRPMVWSLHLQYEELLADPAAGAARIDEFLGGAMDRAAMAAQAEVALRRCRFEARPRHDPSALGYR